jgi:hypothetical protein
MLISDGKILIIDWIMHNDKAWLVPEWFLSSDKKKMQPVRIISLKMAAGHEIKLGEAPLEFFQRNAVPASLLEKGLIPPEFEKVLDVVEAPNFWLPNPAYSH